MQKLRLRNSDSTLMVDYVTDLLGNNDGNFTIMQILGLNDVETNFGMPFRQITNSVGGFKDFATANNLILERINGSSTIALIGDDIIDLDIDTHLLAENALADGSIAEAEVTRVTMIAEGSVKEIERFTLPSTAGAAQGDYVVFKNASGVSFAAWLDIDANGTAPSGAAYIAATNKIKVSIATGNTATQVGTAFYSAITAAGSWSSANITAVDNVNGTVDLTQVNYGAVTSPAKHNTGDTGNGSITFSITATGVNSALSGKYFLLSSPTVNYYAWFNVTGAGITSTDPAVGGKTGIQININAGDSATQVAVASNTAIDALAAFASVTSSTHIDVANSVLGTAVDATAGNSGVSISITDQGAAAAPYSYTFLPVGGNGKYVWSQPSGTLPIGLTLDPVTGILSGTPTTAQSTSFTIQLNDAFTSVSKVFTLNIIEP